MNIKIHIINKGFTLTKVVERINKRGRKETVQNLSKKISRQTIRYNEVLEIADVIGCEIVWQKKKDPDMNVDIKHIETLVSTPPSDLRTDDILSALKNIIEIYEVLHKK